MCINVCALEKAIVRRDGNVKTSENECMCTPVYDDALLYCCSRSWRLMSATDYCCGSFTNHVGNDEKENKCQNGHRITLMKSFANIYAGGIEYGLGLKSVNGIFCIGDG